MFNPQLMKELQAQQSELGKLAHKEYPTLSPEDIKKADLSPFDPNDFGDYFNPDSQKEVPWWEKNFDNSKNDLNGNSEQEVSNNDSNDVIERRNIDLQTINNDDLENWRNDPENEGKLILGEDHDSEVLRHNLEVVTGENPENSSAHHIVGNETPEAAAKLDEYGIDRNDPANGIFLPNCEDSDCKGSLHTGRHMRSYYDEVEQRFQNVSSREEALEALQSLKEDLYNGDLPLQRDVEPNK